MPEYIMFKDLGQDDVLLGRGTGPNEHKGNIRFRDLVRASIEQEAKHSLLNGKSKSDLATRIVEIILARGGRFLKKVSLPNATGPGAQYFEEVPKHVALDKTKQSFRHQIRAIGDRNSKFAEAAFVQRNKQQQLLASLDQASYLTDIFEKHIRAKNSYPSPNLVSYARHEVMSPSLSPIPKTINCNLNLLRAANDLELLSSTARVAELLRSPSQGLGFTEKQNPHFISPFLPRMSPSLAETRVLTALLLEAASRV